MIPQCIKQKQLENRVTDLENKNMAEYELIGKKAGTYSIDIDKYRFLLSFNVYNAYVGSGTKIMAVNLIPTSILKTGVSIEGVHYENSSNTTYMNRYTYSTTDKTVTLEGTTSNNMYPVLYGIKYKKQLKYPKRQIISLMVYLKQMIFLLLCQILIYLMSH